MKGFIPYTKDVLFDVIDRIKIFQHNDHVVTQYYGETVNSTKVSNRYEIFDICSFLKEKVLFIEKNFPITHYRLFLKRGIQELTLISDRIKINNTDYYKSFFILNSTDKSRKLNLNLGLYRADNETYLISNVCNMSLSKKHLKGVTELAETASLSINGETFDEQINSIKSIVGERVMLSELRKIILGEKALQVDHRKFDAFKNQLLNSFTDRVEVSRVERSLLRTNSENMDINKTNDFSIDAYKAFNCYIQVFRNQDSFIVKKETEKILNITQCFIRNQKLEKILEMI